MGEDITQSMDSLPDPHARKTRDAHEGEEDRAGFGASQAEYLGY